MTKLDYSKRGWSDPARERPRDDFETRDDADISIERSRRPTTERRLEVLRQERVARAKIVVRR